VFGDDVFGMSPSETATVTATYRVGGGQNGNVGADTLTVAHPEVPAPWLISVTNPLPATGGRNLESGNHARQFGPPLSRQPLALVSSADYETAAAAFVDSTGQQPIQRAKASFQWTGSWLTVALAVDPFSTDGLTPTLADGLQGYLGARRLAGYDLQISGPAYLPIDLQIQFSVAPGAQSSNVQEALEQVLSNTVLPDGSKGFFQPENFTFGQNLYISKIFAAVMGVPGVQSAQITRLARLHSAQPDAETAANLAMGFLAAGADQIIRLDNDRNFPQNGTLTVVPTGVAQ
jgi:predicted phage baseplate assembly protein